MSRQPFITADLRPDLTVQTDSEPPTVDGRATADTAGKVKRRPSCPCSAPDCGISRTITRSSVALWAFHRVHHSAQVLTPITAFRAHPMELFVPALLQMPVIGLASVFYQNLSPRDMDVATIFGIGLFSFMIPMSGYPSDPC